MHSNPAGPYLSAPAIDTLSCQEQSWLIFALITAALSRAPKSYADTWKAVPLQSPKLVQQQHIPLTTPPIPHLCLYSDSISCRLCTNKQAYICRSREGMQRHLRTEHNWRSPQGKGRQSVAVRLAETAYPNIVTSPVSY